jgi:hypothetical protein
MTPSPRQTLSDLAEDLETSWVPDVAGRGDFAGLAADPALNAEDIASVDVPKPDGRRRAAHQLSVRALSRLHNACQGVAAAVDAHLAPTVCGYRRGAEAGSAYSAEFRRYSDLGTAFAADAPAVLAADVVNFFPTVQPARVVEALQGIADVEAVTDIASVLADVQGLGVAGLAAGYADMRMLANILLSQVDDVLDLPFVRWVDDYRIFLPSAGDAPAVIARLDAALSRIGLALSPAKTRVWPSDEAARLLFARQFASVYHPGEEPPEMVRAALRTVFLDAVGQQQVKRRELRFALPRMAEVHDDLAVEFCQSAFTEMPWEAPRFVAYLTAFADTRLDLGPWTSNALRHAITSNDEWLIVRLMPLAARVAVDDETLDTVAAAAARTQQRATWSHCLRLLGIHHRARDVRALLTSDVADPRAGVAALLDLGDPVPSSLQVGAGAIAFRCSGGDAFPAPSAQSLL